MIIFKKDELYHYGTKYHSGRYPWGSGDHPYQSEKDFTAAVILMKKKGLTEKEIAKGCGIIDDDGEGNIKALRKYITIATNMQDIAIVSKVNRLYDDKYKIKEIAKIVEKSESTVRELLNPLRQERIKQLQTTKDILKQNIEDKKFLDVGIGTELQLGIKRTLLDTAVFALEHEGYKIHDVPVQQLGTGKQTNLKVISKDDVDYQEVRRNAGDIRILTDWSTDGGASYNLLKPVQSIDSNRVKVAFKEDGGANYDGMLFLRRGISDIALPNETSIAQVRVAVDGKYFMKGMAVYKDDLPNGIDIVYNSNKSNSVGKEGAFKQISKDGNPNDPTNPFKTSITQYSYLDKNGKEQLSLINKVGYSTKLAAGEEGYWDSWHSGKALASQFLSKQNVDLAKTQLKLAMDIQKSKFDEINLVTNPAVKQRLLDSFADDCDSKAVHLEGAALPRQSSKVLLSAPSLKENEVYTPAYKNGEKLVLVRYPHAGTFEIPLVTVNNSNKEAQNMLGKSSIDAIAVHPTTAAKLSGADFDGDSVIAIPWSKNITVSPSLKGLVNFDPKVYKFPKEITDSPDFKKMSDKTKGLEMGKISNLITDMQILGAEPDHIARAVRHSMTVIDSQKHDLNYKQSAIDNGINELKTLYQGSARSGASTLISRSTSEVHVPQTRPIKSNEPGYDKLIRRSEYSIDPETGKKVYGYIEAKPAYINKEGITIVPQLKKKVSSQMYETDDAYSLIPKHRSITPMENVYADFANNMKSLGNDARKESASLKPISYSPSAKKIYSEEVDSLNSKLNNALRNAPLERQAQIIGNSILSVLKENNPNLTPSQLRKLSGQTITEARLRVGAGKQRIEISEKEWEAIQAGAINQTTLTKILNNSKIEDVQKLATPRQTNQISSALLARAKNMLGRYTLEQISDMLGISVSTLSTLSTN